MGYHVTILRTEAGQQKPISVDEVEIAIAEMPDLEMKPIPATDVHWPGCFEILLSAYDLADPVILLWQKGEIWTKNPDDATLRVMLDLAKKLNARVRGDEMETYRTVDESYTHPDDLYEIKHLRSFPKQPAQLSKNKWWFLYIPTLVLR